MNAPDPIRRLAVAPSPVFPADRRGRRQRDLRIPVIDRCNFRCVYCMPKGVRPRPPISTARRKIEMSYIGG